MSKQFDMNTSRRRASSRYFLVLIFVFVYFGDTPLLDAQKVSDKTQTPSQTQETDSKAAKLEVLINAAKLNELIKADTEDLIVLEPSADLKDFAKGHIPTARSLHWTKDMTDPKNVELYSNPDKEAFEKLMSRLGVVNSSRIVIYDRFSSRLSTRLFWSLKFYGHEKVQILDGGIAGWQESFKLSNTSKIPDSSDFKVTKVNEGLLVQLDFIKTNLGESKMKLIDGRPADQYSGKAPGKVFHTGKAHAKKGHVPDAVNVFWKDNFESDGRFKSIEDLKTLYTNAGIKPDQCVVTYCNEGLHAAPPWFVLTQLLGYEDVRLYDNSMAEWANSENEVIKD